MIAHSMTNAFISFEAYEYRKAVIVKLYDSADKEMKKQGIKYVNSVNIFDDNPDRVFTDDVHFADGMGYSDLSELICRLI